MKLIAKIIDFILGLFKAKPKQLQNLEDKKEALEKEIKEIEDAKDDTDSNIDYVNDK